MVELSALGRPADLVRQSLGESDKRPDELRRGALLANRGPCSQRPRVDGPGNVRAGRPEAESEDDREASAGQQAPGAQAEQERPRPDAAEVRQPRLEPECR
jgi:hypothetical protein